MTEPAITVILRGGCGRKTILIRRILNIEFVSNRMSRIVVRTDNGGSETILVAHSQAQVREFIDAFGGKTK